MDESSHNFYRTTYRNYVSEWGGRTTFEEDHESRTIDLGTPTTQSRSVARSVKATGQFAPVVTPESEHRAQYKAPHPVTRSIGPTFSMRVPITDPIPEEGDLDSLRPTTEHRSNYKYPRHDPYLDPELVATYSTSGAPVQTRSVSGHSSLAPNWDTEYRSQYCTKVAEPTFSEPVTFHTHTHLR